QDPVAERNASRQTIEREPVTSLFESYHLAGWQRQVLAPRTLIRRTNPDAGGGFTAGRDERSSFRARQVHVGRGRSSLRSRRQPWLVDDENRARFGCHDGKRHAKTSGERARVERMANHVRHVP